MMCVNFRISGLQGLPVRAGTGSDGQLKDSILFLTLHITVTVFGIP